MTKAELDFRQALRDYCHKSGIELGELSGLDRRNRKVMTLLTENGSDILRILYVKYSKYPSPKGFWGFPRLDSNVITTIRGAAREWVLVLLLGDGKHCYVGTSEMAEQAIDKLTPVEDGNYRLHENDIRDWLQIDNRADLVRPIAPSSIVSYPFAIWDRGRQLRHSGARRRLPIQP